MDIFLEHMVKKKKDTGDYFFIICIILAGILLTVLLLLVAAHFVSYAMGLEFMAIALVWYGVYILLRRRHVEYEYVFTNGVLDIDAIYAKRRRGHVLSVKARDMLICAPVYVRRFEEAYLNMSGVKRTYALASSLSAQNIYFADFMMNAERVRLLFEPTVKMITGMKKYNPNNIHLPDAQEMP